MALQPVVLSSEDNVITNGIIQIKEQMSKKTMKLLTEMDLSFDKAAAYSGRLWLRLNTNEILKCTYEVIKTNFKQSWAKGGNKKLPDFNEYY